MRTADRRLSALETRTPADDWLNRPWFTASWSKGEPYPEIPPGHNAIVWQIVEPGDPPEWMNAGQPVLRT